MPGPVCSDNSDNKKGFGKDLPDQVFTLEYPDGPAVAKGIPDNEQFTLVFLF
ncbi:hypothetical protein MASR1M12_30560 [Erysipelotrichia bacterium]